MAQDLSSLFSKAKRKTPDLDLTPEASEVVARDFNLFYKPEVEPVDPSVGIFLKSLDDFVNQAGTKLVMAGEKKEKDILLEFCKEHQKINSVDFYICGHRHQPIDLKINNTFRYINLGDWINNNSYAVFEDNNINLKFFHQENK